MKSGEIDDARLVSMLLDVINYEIVKIIESSQQPFYVGELKEHLDAIGIVRSKPTLIRRLKDLEDIGWIKRVVHGSYEHAKWEPYSSRFYHQLLQHRETITGTVTNLKADIMVAQVVPEAERTYQKIIVAGLEDDSKTKEKKIRIEETRLREQIGWLIRDFDKLDELTKMRMFRWAYKSKYFENLPYT